MASKHEHAIQIASTQDGRIKFHLENLQNILKKVNDCPIAIISVNGVLRSGKSFILGYFLRYLSSKGQGDWINRRLDDEFFWKGSAERQTTGILMWSEPYYLNKDGRRIAVLLIDTEGCFDNKTDSGTNCQVFALSCLLSSVFIYNVKFQMSEDVLQFLQMFLGYARMPLQEGYDEPFSNLVLLIRDWQFPRDYGYGYHDDDNPKRKNFKKDKLNKTSQMHNEAKEVHDAVSLSFKSTACCLLPHPGLDLADEDKTENLRKVFLDVTEEFVNGVFEHIALKTIGGEVMTGSSMSKMVECWGEEISDISTSDSNTIAVKTAEFQNQEAMTNALKHYNDEMNAIDLKRCSGQQIRDLHIEAKQQAVKMFNTKKRMKYKRIEIEYREELLNQIDGALQLLQRKYEEIKDNQRKEAEKEKMLQNQMIAAERKMKLENERKEAEKERQWAKQLEKQRREAENEKREQEWKWAMMLENQRKEAERERQLEIRRIEAENKKWELMSERQRREAENEKREQERQSAMKLENQRKEAENVKREEEWKWAMMLENQRKEAEREKQLEIRRIEAENIKWELMLERQRREAENEKREQERKWAMMLENQRKEAEREERLKKEKQEGEMTEVLGTVLGTGLRIALGFSGMGFQLNR